jgi:hypothetical protein
LRTVDVNRILLANSRQRPAVAVDAGPCGLVGEADALPLDQLAEERGGLVAEPLDRFPRVDTLRGIDPDQADLHLAADEL